MQYEVINPGSFPSVQIELQKGEAVGIEYGSLIYRSENVRVSGLGIAGGEEGDRRRFVKMTGHSDLHGRGLFVTKLQAAESSGVIAIAPKVPGAFFGLTVGDDQYHFDARAFLAMDATVRCRIERMKASNETLLSGSGGSFIISTSGRGCVLLNSYGSIQKISLDREIFTVDNCHVVAWSSCLDCSISSGSPLIGASAAVINTFSGTGEIYIQSMNLGTFAKALKPFLQEHSDG